MYVSYRPMYIHLFKPLLLSWWILYINFLQTRLNKYPSLPPPFTCLFVFFHSCFNCPSLSVFFIFVAHIQLFPPFLFSHLCQHTHVFSTFIRRYDQPRGYISPSSSWWGLRNERDSMWYFIGNACPAFCLAQERNNRNWHRNSSKGRQQVWSVPPEKVAKPKPYSRLELQPNRHQGCPHHASKR